MLSDRKPSLILPVAVTVLLLCAYVGTYYSLVEPTPVWIMIARDEATRTWRPTYRGLWRDAFAFAPIHWLDRRIRPHVWEPE